MRVISWNIQWGRGADGVVNLSRTLETLHALGPADVICLQEVAVNFPELAGAPDADATAILAEAFPDHLLVDAPAVDVAGADGGRSRFGNVMLSRLPVEQIFIHRLPWPPEAGVPSMPRTAIEAVLRLPTAGAIRVVSTHLEYYAAAQRQAQVAYLCQLQRDARGRANAPRHARDKGGPFARRDDPLAAIACGDFNFQPGSDDWCAMTAAADEAAGWFDAWSLRHPGVAHPPSVGVHGADWPEHAFCCDYFFVTRPVAGALQRVSYDAHSRASDHQPLVLELDERLLGG